MAIYKFRILLEDEDNVYRDVEIKPSFSLWDFHQALKMSFAFNDEPEAEVYFSDNNWHELDFIAKIPEGQLNLRNHPALNKPMAGLVNDPHQRFIYKLKTYRNFIFFIELVKISADDAKANYPRTVKSIGEPPRPIKPSLEPPPLDIDESDMPKRRGKSAGFAPILIPGDEELAEPDADDLENDDIAGFIDEANLMDGIDMEGIGEMTIGDDESPSKEFGLDEGFGEDDEDEDKDMGDFDFDSFASGGQEEY